MDHKALEHMRLLAVKRVVEDGEDPSEVMRSLGLCRTSIYRWLRKFHDEGWDALVERIAQGPEPKLNDKQRQQVKRWILGKDPRQYGFDFGSLASHRARNEDKSPEFPRELRFGRKVALRVLALGLHWDRSGFSGRVGGCPMDFSRVRENRPVQAELSIGSVRRLSHRS